MAFPFGHHCAGEQTGRKGDAAMKCDAHVLPLNERKRRPCGQPAQGLVNGRPLCGNHLTVQRRRGAIVEPLPGETKVRSR